MLIRGLHGRTHLMLIARHTHHEVRQRARERDILHGATMAGRLASAAKAVELGYMLGNDRARTYIRATGAAVDNLTTARSLLGTATLGADLYSKWLTAIRELATVPTGAKPSFMETSAFADMRLNTMLTAYGQLRHNHVLVAAQAYDQGGCEIPDGYVEPAPAPYAALADYARHAANAFRSLDRTKGAEAVTYFTRVEKLMKVLVQISREELAGLAVRGTQNHTRRALREQRRDRLAAGLGEVGGVPGLLERPHVVADLLVLLGVVGLRAVDGAGGEGGRDDETVVHGLASFLG
mgnify:CR=1 FL=1